MGRSALHSIQITENGTPDVVTALSATTASLPANVELSEDESGALYDTLIGLRSIKPELTFTSKSVQRLFQLFGIGGGCLGASPRPLKRIDAFFEGKTSCSVASSPNIGYGGTAGLYYLDTLTAPRGQDATLSAKLDFHSPNGSTAPVTKTSGATLPTTINTDTFVLGQPTLGNVAFPEATSVSLRFGITKDEDVPAWGSIYLTDGTILRVQPELTIENADLDLLDALKIPFTGKDAVHAQTSLHFRKKLNRGAFVPDATAQHFSLTMSGFFYFTTLATGQGTGAAGSTLVLRGAKEGATAPIVPTFNKTYG